MTDIGAMALTYVNAGWKVFPLWWVEPEVSGDPSALVCACPAGRLVSDRCASPGKHPYSRLARNGVKNASDDPDVVIEWWRRAPLANIGLPAHDNGLAILDVDPRHGGDRSLLRLRAALVDRGTPLPATLVAETGSGGEHYLFAAPPPGIASKARAFGLDGLDTRGRGGYVVAAPSLHVSGGRYRWADPAYGRAHFFDELPLWPPLLTELMSPTRDDARRAGIEVGPSPEDTARVTDRLTRVWPNVDRYVTTAVAKELAVLRTTPVDGRNDQLNRAGVAIGRFVGAGLLGEDMARRELFAAGLACGLEAGEMPKTINSGVEYGKSRPFVRPGARR